MASLNRPVSAFGQDRLVQPFPDISGYISNKKADNFLPTNLRRPSSFMADRSYGTFLFKQEQPLYGYALVQRPYSFMPMGSTSVYMSCYTSNYGTITNGSPTNDPHYYVNGNFLAEAAALEAERLRTEVLLSRGSSKEYYYFGLSHV